MVGFLNPLPLPEGEKKTYSNTNTTGQKTVKEPQKNTSASLEPRLKERQCSIASREAASLWNHSRGRSKGSKFDLIKAAGGSLLHSNEASSQLRGPGWGAGLYLLTHRLFVSLPCLPSHTFK